MSLRFRCLAVAVVSLLPFACDQERPCKVARCEADAGAEVVTDAGTAKPEADAGDENVVDAGTAEPEADAGDAGVDGGVRPPPSDGGFVVRVGAWNVEFFGSDAGGPTNEDLQRENVRKVIERSQFDLLGLEEVSDPVAFETLKTSLPRYDGLLSSDPRVQDGAQYYQDAPLKLGVLFKPELFTLKSARLILTADRWLFAGRPPLELTFEVKTPQAPVLLTMIVVHFKAQFPSADPAFWETRRQAAGALQRYLEASHRRGNVLVVGDWNDDVDDSVLEGYGSPFLNFLEARQRFRFVTEALSRNNVSSTTHHRSFIDHHLITSDLFPAYVTDSAAVLHPDSYIEGYGYNTSDHYPVESSYRL